MFLLSSLEFFVTYTDKADVLYHTVLALFSMLLVLVLVVRIAWNSGYQFELKREMIESSML